MGVDHGGLAATHQLGEWADLGRYGDLRKAGGARQRRHAALVSGAAKPVEESHRHGPVAGAEGLLQSAPGLLVVEFSHDRAVGGHTLVHLEHTLVHRRRQMNVEREDPGTVLVADAQRVAEPSRGHEQGGLAAALEQRIGGHRGAHAHLGDVRGRYGLGSGDPEQVAHSLHGGVGVAIRVFREQLAGDERSVGATSDHVGEGAAAVDPEVPAIPEPGLWRCGVRASAAHGVRLPRAPGRRPDTCREAQRAVMIG